MMKIVPVVCGVAMLAASVFGESRNALPLARGFHFATQAANESVFKRVSDWNVNSITTTILLDDKTRNKVTDIPGPGKELEPYRDSLAVLDKQIEYCRTYNMLLHVRQARPMGKMSKEIWRDNETGEAFRAYLVRFWAAFAGKYRDVAGIASYETFGEPNYSRNFSSARGKRERELWQTELMPACVKAIRAVDMDRLIIVAPGPGGSPAGFDTLEPVDDPNVMYSFHQYTPHSLAAKYLREWEGAVTYSYPGAMPLFGKKSGVRHIDKDYIEEHVLKVVVDFQERYGVNVHCGEFGVVRWAPGADQWIIDNIDLFEAHGWNWHYHMPEAKWNAYNHTYPPENRADGREGPKDSFGAHYDGGYRSKGLGYMLETFKLNKRTSQ